MHHSSAGKIQISLIHYALFMSWRRAKQIEHSHKLGRILCTAKSPEKWTVQIFNQNHTISTSLAASWSPSPLSLSQPTPSSLSPLPHYHHHNTTTNTMIRSIIHCLTVITNSISTTKVALYHYKHLKVCIAAGGLLPCKRRNHGRHHQHHHHYYCIYHYNHFRNHDHYHHMYNHH